MSYFDEENERDRLAADLLKVTMAGAQLYEENKRLRAELGMWKVQSTNEAERARAEAERLRVEMTETREQLQQDFAIRCRCDFVTKLPAGIERCVGCRARDRITAIDSALADTEVPHG